MRVVESREARGKRVLVVEDEYLLAMDIANSLEDMGVEVIGPAASVNEALILIEKRDEPLDAAVLDINLRNERVYPVADRLSDRGIPYVFTTGYDLAVIPDDYSGVQRCEKPVNSDHLVRVISSLLKPD